MRLLRRACLRRAVKQIAGKFLSTRIRQVVYKPGPFLKSPRSFRVQSPHFLADSPRFFAFLATAILPSGLSTKDG